MNTKDKILKTALKLFAKNGIANTSTADITGSVGVASGTLFVHFKKKQDLIDDIYIKIKRDLSKLVSDKFDESASTETNIRNTSEGVIDYFIFHSDAFRFVKLIENSPAISSKAIEVADEFLQESRELISSWIQKGKLKNIDSELVQSTIWSNIMNIVEFYLSKSIKDTNPKHIDLIWESIRSS